MSSFNSFGLKYVVLNYSNELLVIKLKGGLSYLVRKSKEPTFELSRTLKVTLSDIFLKDLNVDVDNGLTLLDKKILELLKAEKERLINRRESFYEQLTSDLTIIIPLTADLVEAYDGIHSEMLGVTFYIGDTGLNKPALNTPNQTIREMSGEETVKGSLMTNLYVNDPKKIIPVLYTNVLGKSREVPTLADLNITTGLYVSFSNNNIPETRFYKFEEITNTLLQQLGLFTSKQECDKGGNTEQCLLLKEKLTQTQKELANTISKMEVVKLSEVKLIENLNRLNTDIIQLKHEHKLEIAGLKINNSQIKTSFDLYKYEAKFKEMLAKNQMETIKNKSDSSNWTDVAKSFATIAGVAFTGYQLFSA